MKNVDRLEWLLGCFMAFVIFILIGANIAMWVVFSNITEESQLHSIRLIVNIFLSSISSITLYIAWFKFFKPLLEVRSKLHNVEEK